VRCALEVHPEHSLANSLAQVGRGGGGESGTEGTWKGGKWARWEGAKGTGGKGEWYASKCEGGPAEVCESIIDDGGQGLGLVILTPTLVHNPAPPPHRSPLALA